MEEGQRLMEDELGYKQGYLVLILVVMEEGQRPGKLSSPVDDTELS